VIACSDPASERVALATLPLVAVAPNADVIFSRERAVSPAGVVLEEKTAEGPRPSDLWDRLEGAGISPDGKRYMFVMGAKGDKTGEERFQYLVESPDSPAPVDIALKPQGTFVGEAAASKHFDPDLAARAAAATSPAELVEIYIDAVAVPETPLGRHVSASIDWLPESEKLDAVDERIEARKKEVASLQAQLLSALANMGAQDIEGFWLTGNAFARVPAGKLSSLLAHGDVRGLYLNQPIAVASPTTWDGYDMRAWSGLNTGAFLSNGYNGEAAGGKTLKLAVIDTYLDTDHPGFDDYSWGSSRVLNSYNCNNNPCTSPAPTPLWGIDTHGTTVAGLAAGDITEGQMGAEASATPTT